MLSFIVPVKNKTGGIVLKKWPQTYRVKDSKDTVTANAGVLPLAGLCQQQDLFDWMDRHLMSYDSNRAYAAHEYAFTQVANHATGGTCLDDSRAISADETLKQLLQLSDLPAPNTLGSWFRTARWQHVHRLRKKNRELAWDALHQEGRDTVRVDIDAKVHASDNRGAKWTYKKVRGYCPLYVTVPGDKLVLDHLFRPGDHPPKAHNASMVRTLLRTCPAWVQTLQVSLDAAGWQVEVIAALQQADEDPDRDVHYYVRPAAVSDEPSNRVKGAIAAIAENEWSPWRPEGDTDTDPRQRELAETVVTIGEATGPVETDAMRLVVVREPISEDPDQLRLEDTGGYRYATVATNDTGRSAQEVVQRYNQRGAAEDVIGEVVADGLAERFPMQDDKGNALYLGLNILTFNLLQRAKEQALSGKWASLTHASLRKRVICVAARISKHSRYVNIKLSKGFPWVGEFLRLLRSCWGPPPRRAG